MYEGDLLTLPIFGLPLNNVFTDNKIVMMMEPPGVCDRSLEEVSAMITHAKLIESDLLPLSQVVR